MQKLLASFNIQKGDKVAILSRNMPNWGIAYFAITSIGAIAVPMLPDFHEKEIQNIIEHSEARVLFVSKLMLSKIEKLDNPFIVTGSSNEAENNDSNIQPVYLLEATFNQKAKINGAWYIINDQISTWKLVKINRNSVILQNETEKKEIFIRTKDERNIKIFSK